MNINQLPESAKSSSVPDHHPQPVNYQSKEKTREEVLLNIKESKDRF